MKAKTKRNILYFFCFLGGFLIWEWIGGWGGLCAGFGGAYWVGCKLSETLGWRRASTADDAIEHWNKAKKQEAASYGDDLNTILIAMLAKLAKLDGKVSKNEISIVEKILLELGFIGDGRQAAIELFRKAKTGPLTFYNTVLIAKHFCGENPQAGRLIMLLLIQLGHADGKISDNIQEALQDASTAMGFCYEEILKAFAASSENQAASNSHIEDAYVVMGCSYADTNATIKAKYRELARTFHPDMIAAKALPPEFIKFAEDRFKQIQASYEVIVESRRAT